MRYRNRVKGLTAGGHFDERHAALYFVDIMHGLAYLHRYVVVVRVANECATLYFPLFFSSPLCPEQYLFDFSLTRDNYLRNSICHRDLKPEVRRVYPADLVFTCPFRSA